jgi:hypothetical protein
MIREVWQALFGEDITTKRQINKSEYRTICPYHREQNPSCDVNVEKEVFFCRSCGACGFTDAVILAGNARTSSEAFIWLKNHGVRVE